MPRPRTDKEILKTLSVCGTREFRCAQSSNCSKIVPAIDLSDMAGKQAKTLSTDHIDDLLFFAERSRHPLRNRLIVLLSVRQAFAPPKSRNLSWDMVLESERRGQRTLSNCRTRSHKKRGGRSIPLHDDLREALDRGAATM